MSFLKPKVPAAAAPPPAPVVSQNDPSVMAAADEVRRRRQIQRGLAATVSAGATRSGATYANSLGGPKALTGAPNG